jgi:hypothetical protein
MHRDIPGAWTNSQPLPDAQLANEIRHLGLNPARDWRPSRELLSVALTGNLNPYPQNPPAPTYPLTPFCHLQRRSLAVIRDHLSHRTQTPRLLEVGSFLGRSALTLLSAAPDSALLVCVDTWLGDLNMRLMERFRPITCHPGHRMYEAFLANTWTNRNQIVPLRLSSIPALRLLRVLGWRPDLIFLDSAHEAGESYLEIGLAYSLLAPGGLLLGDDYGAFPGLTFDLDLFCDRHCLTLAMTGDPTIWSLEKPA